MFTRMPAYAMVAVSVTGFLSVPAISAMVGHRSAIAAAGFSPPAVALDATITRPLVPGGAPVDLNYTITNTGGTPQYVTGVTISITGATYAAAAGSGAGTTWASHPAGGPAPGCTAADYAIVQPDALGQNLAPGATSFTRHTNKKSGTIAMNNTGRVQNDCMGARLTLAVSIA